MNRLNEYKVKQTNDGRYFVAWKSNACPVEIWHFDTDFIPTANKAEAKAYAKRMNR